MENRFENLYGYVQRSLVKNIRKELANDSSMIVGILLYNSYVDSFYYEGTVKNPLLFPSETQKLFVENEIWNFELMYVLAKYIAKAKMRGAIADLLRDNYVLSRNNASYYAIAFDRYDDFKSEWEEWLEKLDDLLRIPFSKNDVSLTERLNQLFHFAGYLLTIIRIPAYRNNFDPEQCYFSEYIYRTVTGQLPEMEEPLTETQTGNLPPPKDGLLWRAKPDNMNKYAELTVVLELCFKQPIQVNEKIRLLRMMLQNGDYEDFSFRVAIMAKPLVYNGEFQGIIYVLKDFDEGNFQDEDYERFIRAVVNFHFQSIIHTSRFDTARIFLEKVTEADLQLKVHALIKVLSIQHIFSSASIGIILQPDDGSYIRYRENKFMRSEKTSLTADRFCHIFQKEFVFDLKEKLSDNNHYWHDFTVEETIHFNLFVNKYFDVNEAPDIRSVTCLKFSDQNASYYYLLFYANNTEVIKGDPDDAVKQSFALRTQSNISRLINSFVSAKRLADIQNNLLNELQLGILHEQKSFLRTKIIKQLEEIGQMNPKKQISKKVEEIKAECDTAILRFEDFLKVMAEQSNDMVSSTVNKKGIEEMFDSLKITHRSKSYKLITDTLFINEMHSIQSYKYTIRFILDELISNAIKQYSSPIGQAIPKKEIRVSAYPTTGNGKLIGFGFEVVNSGTAMPDSMIEYAGKERISNGANNSSGFGFYFIQNMLKRVLPNPNPDGKYFSIRNTPEGLEVKFYVYYKPLRK